MFSETASKVTKEDVIRGFVNMPIKINPTPDVRFNWFKAAILEKRVYTGPSYTVKRWCK